MNIWFTSDTHYNHKNIVRGTTQWESGQFRNFDNLPDHNWALVKNINDVVQGQDILYHLGDWSFGGFDSIREFRERLNVGIIHLILGNHDHHIENNKDEIRQLFASVNHVKFKKIGTSPMFLSHYSHRVWNKGGKDCIHLYGHSHGNLPDYHEINSPQLFKCMDVGVDTNHLKPYHIDTIYKIMDKRISLNVDHHGEKN